MTDHSPASVGYYFWMSTTQKLLFESGDMRPLSIEQHISYIRRLAG